jgi:hypothetical protein
MIVRALGHGGGRHEIDVEWVYLWTSTLFKSRGPEYHGLKQPSWSDLGYLIFLHILPDRRYHNIPNQGAQMKHASVARAKM